MDKKGADTSADRGHAEEARSGRRRMPVAEKNLLVKSHFDAVAGRYDFMNTLLSFGLHHLWKKETAGLANIRTGDRVLDVCGGTADLALRAAGAVGDRGLAVLLDINRAMLEAARPKITRSPFGGRISLIRGDAENLPCADASFDAAMVGFGIRNLADAERGFREMHRVLRPGGRLVCLEFSTPVNPLFRALYDFYSFAVIPAAGLLLAGSRQAYTYLPQSIRTFPDPESLAEMLEEIGFGEVCWRMLTNGIAAVHTGIKAR